MTPVDRDEFVHALGQTLAFYGKDLDTMQTSFWVTACSDKPIASLKKSLLEHVKFGKYAPRPADILSLVDAMAIPSQRAALPPPQETQCPPEIAQAWQWFIGRCTAGSNLEGLFENKSDIDLDTQEKYLHVINHEAHKYQMPEAIPDEFKLSEVWG